MLKTDAEIAAITTKFVEAVKNTIPVEQVILFGSYAKGNPHAYSDIDLAVISPIFGENPLEDRTRLYRTIFTNKLDSLIEPHPFSPSEPLSFLTEVVRTGKVIYQKKML